MARRELSNTLRNLKVRPRFPGHNASFPISLSRSLDLCFPSRLRFVFWCFQFMQRAAAVQKLEKSKEEEEEEEADEEEERVKKDAFSGAFSRPIRKWYDLF